MSELDTEWLEALEIEPPTGDAGGDSGDGGAGDTNDDEDGNKGAGAVDDTAKGTDAGGVGGADDGAGDAVGTEGVADDAGKNSATDDTKSDGKDGIQADGKSDDAAAAVDPKTVVKEAIQEIETSRQQRYNHYEGLKKQVTETLYPEGIDRQLRDTSGAPITGIEDLTKLINPQTQDYFTDEEAGQWLLAAQQKLNKDVETVERFIEGVAETNLLLTEGAQRVAEKYTAILSADPALKNRLLTAYNKTLVKDPKSGVALRAPIDVEEFFDLALEPLVAQAAAKAEADKQAKIEADKKAKTAQGERGDLKPHGKSERLNDTDKEWAQAIKDYEEGV